MAAISFSDFVTACIFFRGSMLRSRCRDVFRVSASLVTSMQLSGLFQSASRSEYAVNVTFL